MIEIKIPERNNEFCPAACEMLYQGKLMQFCGISAQAEERDWVERIRPGTNCPGPGTYVLAPKAQWEAAQGACAAFCKLSREFGIQTELAQLAHRALGEEAKNG
jgi:hypothetical protein